MSSRSLFDDWPVVVDFEFYAFYKEVYPKKQVNQEKIKKRKVPVIGDVLQSSDYEKIMAEFNEVLDEWING